jgi:ribosomal protein S18 acetylase RimI-like enzyme
VALVAVEGGAVHGFVLGSAHPETLRRQVLRHNRAATLAALAAGIAKRPSSIVWLLRSVRGPDEGGYDDRAAELTYLAVDGPRRGSGAGTRLVQAFSRAMRESGVTSYELSVDEDNPNAIGFYEAQGFSLIGRYREFGMPHRRYRLDVR